jgi:acetyltransferase-like isoleucine patch superfamily enzyme
MILANRDTIRLIGFLESTITQEAKFFISAEFTGKIEIISPQDFIKSDHKDEYSYLIAFTLDETLRRQIINIIDKENLDCIIYIHPSVVRYYNDASVREHVGIGSFILAFSSMLIGSKLGKHCIVETYCLISHYVNIDDNVQLHSGVMIAGRTNIGKNCMFNFKASVLNSLNIGSDVELGAASCITKDTLMPGKYVGSPARRIGDRTKFIETLKHA